MNIIKRFIFFVFFDIFINFLLQPREITIIYTIDSFVIIFIEKILNFQVLNDHQRFDKTSF